MSSIREFLKDLEKLLDDIPCKLSTKIQSESRGDIALYLKGTVVFTDHSELHFKEYLIAVPTFKKLAYSYHYQSKDKELIFRFDNAEHHLEIDTYPYHKHLKDNVVQSKEMSLKETLDEILPIVFKGEVN